MSCMIPERDGVRAFPQKQSPASSLPASFSLPFPLIHFVSFLYVLSLFTQQKNSLYFLNNKNICSQ